MRKLIMKMSMSVDGFVSSAVFMQNLIATGLIDEYHLAIHPVALGSGLQIFAGLEKALYLKSAEVKAFPGGALAKTYCV